MAHVIVAEDLVDRDFIDNHTEGFEAVREAVARYTPEEAEEVTGVSAEDIRWTARRYAPPSKAGIYYTLGITEHSHGTDNVYALANLVLMTGHLGKPSAGHEPAARPEQRAGRQRRGRDAGVLSRLPAGRRPGRRARSTRRPGACGFAASPA